MSLDYKSIAIIVDDFTYRSDDYQNVIVYDYADYTLTTFFDNYLFDVNQFSPTYGQKYDYGDVDDSSTQLVYSIYENVDLLNQSVLVETNSVS